MSVATPKLSMAEKYSGNNKMKVIIIGGVAAGPKTGATLARRMPEAEIILFQKEENVSYGTCGLPYFASGDVGSFEELTKTSYGVIRDADFFKRSKGFDVVTNAEVIKIDRDKKEVTVKLIKSGEISKHSYDKLVLAVGAKPTPPPFPVASCDTIRPFTKPDDAIYFRKLAEQGQIDKVAIIGGGFIGCELAEAVVSMWGIEATLIEKENQLLPYVLDPEMAHLIGLEMKKQGVNLLTGQRVATVELDVEENPEIKIGDGEEIESDFVFLCLGVQPETALAKDCGLKIGETGGISVNRMMQTSDSDIFAGGDCVENIHQLTKNNIYLPMGSLANRHGRVIAENITGNKIKFPGVLGTFLVKIFDLNVGAVGLTEKAAVSAGLIIETVLGSFADIPDFYPEGGTFTLKMVYEKKTERLLGLQAVGTGDICRRIDTFSSLLQKKSTVSDLFDFEHGYAPPYSEAVDSLHHLAGMVRAKSAGFSFSTPENNRELYLTWLDVREPEEVEATPWPYVEEGYNQELIHIPLNDLKERLKELDPRHKIMILCRRGPRSYQAAVILKKAGFDNVSIVSGGTQAVLS